MLTYAQAEKVVAAIYQTEGGAKTRYPYGIKSIKTNNPQRACFKTVMHEAIRLHVAKVDRYFIYMLADKYCPSSVDPRGNKNWSHNMIAILHL